MVQPIENENQAQHSIYWIQKFRARLQLLDVERASLVGIVRELEDELLKYRSGIQQMLATEADEAERIAEELEEEYEGKHRAQE